MGICESFSKNKNSNNNETSFPPKNYTNIKNNNNSINNYTIIEKYEKTANNECDGLENDKTQIKEGMENLSNDEINISSEQSEKISNQSKIYICKIFNGKKKGTGFLCKIPFPDKYNCLPVLMTNYHVITKEELLNNKMLKITFNDDKIGKNIIITSERKIYSLDKEKYDLTIIEIIPEEDKIFHFFEMEYVDVTNKYINSIVYVLQYPGGKECSISHGKIRDIQKFNIYHDCSTIGGSSGGPILLLKNYKLIGIHKGFDPNVNYNIGSLLKEPIEMFNSNYLNKNKISKNKYVNCIICEYDIKNEENFDLLYDYNDEISGLDKELKQLYNEAKKKKQFLEKNINLYIDDELKKFKFKYKTKKKKINVKFVFKEILTDMSFLFYKCKCLKTVDLSPFNAFNVSNMSHMFSGCHALESIDFFSFNTSNVTNMSDMFSECESLNALDLSSFNTTKVINMSEMFFQCSSIKRLDLNSFDTINVINMSKMFANCYSLKFLYISSLKTNNVINMKQMFSRCSSIKSINLTSFNTSKVVNMEGMFEYCSALESLNVTSFETINVKNMAMMFMNCITIKSLNLSSFNTINVENMSWMFSGNLYLETLDLSSFNTINVTNMSSIFLGCIALKTVKCNDHNLLKLKNLKNNLFI